MDPDPVLFEVRGRLRDGWGNDHGAVEDRPVEEPEGKHSADGSEEDGPPKGVADMKGEELKAELKRRQDEGREIDTSGVKTVTDLRNALLADDEAQAREAQANS